MIIIDFCNTLVSMCVNDTSESSSADHKKAQTFHGLSAIDLLFTIDFISDISKLAAQTN